MAVMPSELRELRESEQRLRLLLEHVGDAVFMLDCAGAVVTWTAAAERILGYAAEEALTLHAADFHRQDEREQARAGLECAIASGRAEAEGWRIAKGGRMIWARVVTCPIHGAEKELRGFAQIVQDRTALRAAEDLLALRTQHLEHSNKELEVFASVASHDLQEPLRKLRTFSDRLKKRFAASLDAEASALVSRMDDSAQRMQALIDDLLTYSRLARRVRPLDPVDLTAVVQDVLSDLSLPVEQSRARIELGDLPTLPADPTRMRQLFQNLLANALKFARAGIEPIIRITSVQVEDGAWELRVEDNGIGFEQKYAERIFGLFQRLHGRTAYAGTGIGLAICQRIAEGHGGSIRAQGTLGQGATFTVRLPMMTSDARAAQ